MASATMFGAGWRLRACRRVPLVGLAALLAATGALVAARPAGGHAAATTFSPAPDLQLIEPPPVIRIVFGERVTGGAGALRLVDAAGRSRADPARIDGRELTAQVRGTLRAGRYGYAYVVRSADGHPIRRAIAFAVRSPTPKARATTLLLSGRPVGLSGAQVGRRSLRLWGGLREGTAEWRHPYLDAPFIWSFRAGRASGILPFAGRWTVTVRAVSDGFSTQTATGSVTIAAEARSRIESRSPGD